jgi:hypothetical protein
LLEIGPDEGGEYETSRETVTQRIRGAGRKTGRRRQILVPDKERRETENAHNSSHKIQTIARPPRFKQEQYRVSTPTKRPKPVNISGMFTARMASTLHLWKQ